MDRHLQNMPICVFSSSVSHLNIYKLLPKTIPKSEILFSYFHIYSYFHNLISLKNTEIHNMIESWIPSKRVISQKFQEPLHLIICTMCTQLRDDYVKVRFNHLAQLSAVCSHCNIKIHWASVESGFFKSAAIYLDY